MRKAVWACAILIVAAAAVNLWGLPRSRQYAVGDAVVVIQPAATALYSNNGKPARDDEPLYGMAGTVVGGTGADGAVAVRMQYGYVVRLHGGDLLLRSRATAAWRSEPGHVVSEMYADILPAPDLKAHPPLATLPRGAYLWCAGEEGDYRRVVLHDGGTGYVRKVLIREVRTWEDGDERTNRERVVADALSYRGSPYRWGGKSPQGIDCSGLASMAYLLNGQAIHRNSTPRAGYPIALVHVAPLSEGGYDRQALAGVRKGDLIYWQGHQAVYLGEGKYIHANASTYAVSVHSFFKGDPDFNAELAKPGAVLTWGTAYPNKPEKLTVRQFIALSSAEPGRYRFYARLDGYAPTTAVLYPEGKGEGKPSILIDDPAEMVYGLMGVEGKNIPAHTYAAPGKYYPVIEFTNANGWLPEGKPLTTGPVRMAVPVTIE